MLLKPGVDISRLLPPIRKRLTYLDKIFTSFDCEMVITCTYEGNHLPGSLHYANLAVGLRLPTCSKRDIDAKIREYLGGEYDIVWESDHIHIEYDPK